jgi:hypothetical protein
VCVCARARVLVCMHVHETQSMTNNMSQPNLVYHKDPLWTLLVPPTTAWPNTWWAYSVDTWVIHHTTLKLSWVHSCLAFSLSQHSWHNGQLRCCHSSPSCQ